MARTSDERSVGEGLERVLAEQARYYRDRASEYEDWWYRRGRYDRGPSANRRWFAQAAQVQAAVQRQIPAGGSVLELACGSGLWTALLAARAASLTALDAAPQMLALARAKVPASAVHFVEADIFAWEPTERYDLCFFGFWLSHVPLRLMPSFWDKVARSLHAGGRVCFVDSARSERSSAREHQLQQPHEELMLRRLADGREYHIVKHWFDAPTLEDLLRALGWHATVAATDEFFVHGHASLAH